MTHRCSHKETPQYSKVGDGNAWDTHPGAARPRKIVGYDTI